VLNLLRTLAEPHKIGGWTGFLLVALLVIAEWQGAFNMLVPAVEAVGGKAAAAMLEVLASPVVMVVLAFWSGYSLWAVSVYKSEQDRRYLASLTWIMLAVFAVPLSSVALFGYLVANSNIPDAVIYYERQQAERRLNQKDREAIYAALRKIDDRLPPFSVGSARDPEAVQFAYDFLSMFFSAGLRLENGRRQEAKVELLDLTSPSYYQGLTIGVADRRSPPTGALVLRDALAEAGIATRFVDLALSPDGKFMLIVGPK
jgi:hypothetical protein